MATIQAIDVMVKELLHGHSIFVVQQTVARTNADSGLNAAS
ncbi:hypothetical protein [Herpetosiphon gulosus]